MKLAVLAAGVAMLVGGGAPSPPTGLTARGVALWQLEALLRDTFGSKTICTTAAQGFTAGTCAPLSTYRPYSYVFATARGSRFRLTARGVDKLSTGNRPGWIAIRGRAVACDRAETRFLFHYEYAAGFSVACLTP